jgi:hypothetical protein
VFCDDGTWNKKGDACLKDSPLRRGTVTRRSRIRGDEVYVEWDDGDIRPYLDHGLDAEKPDSDKAPLYLVMAKTYEDVNIWIRENKVQRHRVIYASSVKAILGVRNATLIKLPNHWEHPAFHDINREIPKLKGLVK